MEFKDLPGVKKGNLGEQIVDEWLDKQGLIVYEPSTDNAHGFDRLVSVDKSSLVIVEVKTKPKRLYYPDTGINIKHFEGYKKVSEKHSIPLCIFFVDEILKQIYCGWLSELVQEKQIKWKGKRITYPLTNKEIVYFYQPRMKVIHHLTDDEAEQIKLLSNRSYNY